MSDTTPAPQNGGSSVPKIEARVSRGIRGIFGWAWFPERPEFPVVIEVVADGKVVAGTICDLAAPTELSPPTGARGFLIPRQAFGRQTDASDIVLKVVSTSPSVLLGKFNFRHSSKSLDYDVRFDPTTLENIEYRLWVSKYDEETQVASPTDQANDAMKISVVVLPSHDQAPDLTSTFRCLKYQSYPNWDLIIPEAFRREAELYGLEATGVRGPDLCEYLSQITSKMFVCLDGGDSISRNALHLLSHFVERYPRSRLTYSDEDVFEGNDLNRFTPYFKGSWSRDLQLSQDYTCRASLISVDAVRFATGPATFASLHTMLLRYLRDKPDKVVTHCPYVLYHRSRENDAFAMSAEQLTAAAEDVSSDWRGETFLPKVEEQRVHIVWPIARARPLVSLLIPTRDRMDLLKPCIEGLRFGTDYPSLEIVIVDNGSEEAETLSYLEALQADPRVRILRDDLPFNHSRLNNQAALHTSGEILGVLNNDIGITDPLWLDEMVSHSLREDVGAVGALLHYEDGTIQHAGVILGMTGVASHVYKGLPGDSVGHGERLTATQDLSAVTAACMTVSKAVWREVGGFDEDFPTSYNDVDLCLRIRRAGYRIIWTPFAKLNHLESATRGRRSTPEEKATFQADRDRMFSRWEDVLREDPFFNPNLSTLSTTPRLAFPPRLPS